jgi:hypothetical protein
MVVLLIKCKDVVSISQRGYMISSRPLYTLGYSITIAFTKLIVRASML